MSTGYMTPERKRRRGRYTSHCYTHTHSGESAGCADTPMCSHSSAFTAVCTLTHTHKLIHTRTHINNPDR